MSTEDKTTGTPAIANGRLQKVFEEDTSLSADQMLLFAQALKVSPEWLAWGKGTAPKPTGEVPDRRKECGIIDPLKAIATKAEAAYGASLAAPANPLEAAIQTLVDELDAETIAKVVEAHRGLEGTKPAHHWARILRDAERERRAALPPSKQRTKREKPQSKTNDDPKPKSTRNPVRRAS